MSQATTASINEAIQNLEAVKDNLVGMATQETQLQSLLEEKEALERDIATLKYEKRDLEISIDCLQLRHKTLQSTDLGDEAVDDFAAISGTSDDSVVGSSDDESTFVSSSPPIHNVFFAKHTKTAKAHKKSKYSKVSKKWRRMIRSSRLQSIIVE